MITSHMSIHSVLYVDVCGFYFKNSTGKGLLTILIQGFNDLKDTKKDMCFIQSYAIDCT